MMLFTCSIHDIRRKDINFVFVQRKQSFRCLMMGFSFVILVCLAAAQTEDPLDHFDWRKGVGTPKYLFTFVEYFLMLSLKQTDRDNFQIIIHLLQAKIHSRLFKRQAEYVINLMPQSKACTETYEHGLVAPVTKVILSNLSGFCQQKKIQLKYRFMFVLHVYLRLNLTLNCVNLLDVSGHCVPNYIKVLAVRHFVLFYCGALSHFNLFLPSPPVEFVAHTKDTLVTAFDTTFSVLARFVVSNNVLNSAEGFHLKPFFVHDIFTNNLTIFTYKIRVHKYQTLLLNYVFKHKQNVTFYDGPGFLCSKTIFAGKYHYKKVSSFQCLLQEIQHKVYNKLCSMNYTGHLILSAKHNVYEHNVIELFCAETPIVEIHHFVSILWCHQQILS